MIRVHLLEQASVCNWFLIFAALPILRTIKAILGAFDDTTPFIRDCSIMDSLIVQSTASFGSSLCSLQSKTMLWTSNTVSTKFSRLKPMLVWALWYARQVWPPTPINKSFADETVISTGAYLKLGHDRPQVRRIWGFDCDSFHGAVQAMARGQENPWNRRHNAKTHSGCGNAAYLTCWSEPLSTWSS